MSGRSPALPLLVMAMECCWLAALLLTVDAALPGAHGLELAVWVLIYPVAHVMACSARRLGAGFRQEWALGGAVLVLALWGVAVLPMPEGTGSSSPGLHNVPFSGTGLRRFAAAVVVLVGGLRGWMLQQRPLERADVSRAFQFGLIALLPAAMIKQAGAAQVLLAVAFVGCALLAQWLARVAPEGATNWNEDKALALAPLVLLGLLVVLAAGVTAAILVDRQALLALWSLPAWLAEQFGLWQESAGPATGGEAPFIPPAKESTGRAMPSEAPPWLRWIFDLVRGHEAVMGAVVVTLLSGLFALFAWFAWRGLRWSRRSSTPGLVYRRSRSTLRDLLLRWWRAWRARLGALAHRLWQRVCAWARAWRPDPDRSVQGLYRQALHRLARRGWRRSTHESAEEYLRRLLVAWPGSAEGAHAFSALTAAFVADRYGPRRIAVVRVQAAWAQWRKARRKLKRPGVLERDRQR